MIAAKNNNNNMWLKVCLDDAYIPVPMSQIDSYKVIFYEQPNPKRLQFLALHSLKLDISTTDISKKKEVPSEDVKNFRSIIDYGHQLNGELEPVSDDLDIVLVQVHQKV